MRACLLALLLLGCMPPEPKEPAQEQPRAPKKKMMAEEEPQIELINPLGACGQWIAKRGANQKWRIHYVCADLTRRTS